MQGSKAITAAGATKSTDPAVRPFATSGSQKVERMTPHWRVKGRGKQKSQKKNFRQSLESADYRHIERTPGSRQRTMASMERGLGEMEQSFRQKFSPRVRSVGVTLDNTSKPGFLRTQLRHLGFSKK